MDRSTEREVWQRAANCCEYCRTVHSAYETRFQIDHIIARQHGGTDRADNLALSCFRCNTFKGPNLAGIDPESGQMVRLFNPRRDAWDEHFLWRGARLAGMTDVDRATIAVLAINHPDYVAVRESLMSEGLFPVRPTARP